MGSIGKKSTFTEHSHVAYQIKGNHEMQQHGSKYLPADLPLPTLGMGSIGQNQLFQNMVTLHIKDTGNQEMQQHGSKYFAAEPLPHDSKGWSQNFRIQFSKNMAILRVKLK